MTVYASLSEAKAKLAELVRQAADQDVVLMRHSHPAAVIMSTARHAELMETLDDLEDRLAVHESAGEPAMSLDALSAELEEAG